MPGNNSSAFCARKRLIVVAVSACFASAPAWSNPTAPQVVNGSASFNQAGKLLTVNNSNGAIINWNSFSIGAGEITRFNQASVASSVLNRVITNDPSVLLGTLSSNGRVWLVNPGGIMVGRGARIDVAGFIASTLNVRNEDFLAGRLNFGATPNAGSIQNYGQITTPTGGSVYLVAPNIENHGIINAPNGEVLLAAGQTAQLIDTGTPGVKVDITGAEGNATNLGEIVADAGRIGIAGVLVKNSGTLDASSVVKEGGRIFLKASKDAYVDGAGRIITTGTKGGSIEVLGNRVAVMDQAQLDASGSAAGGTVLVGGDFQGKNPEVQNANITYFGPESSIRADATGNGNGGKVIVWADDTTRAYGHISARGGRDGGSGGFVETSGHRSLDASGIQVDARSVHGESGIWLLDPDDISITNGSGTAQIGSPYLFAPGATSSITDGTINATLNAGTDVKIKTTSSGTGGSGDILMSGIADIATSSVGRKLQLEAERNIDLQGTIRTASSGSLSVELSPGVSGTGKVTTGSGNTLTLNGAGGALGIRLVEGKTWDNSGTVTLQSDAYIELLNSAVFNNKAAAVFNADVNSSFDATWPVRSFNTTGGATPTYAANGSRFDNSGTFNAGGPSATKAISRVEFNNQPGGVFNISGSSDWSLENAGTLSGTVDIPSGRTLRLSEYQGSGTPIALTNTNITGSGTLWIGNHDGGPNGSAFGIPVALTDVAASGIAVNADSISRLTISGNAVFGTLSFADFFGSGTAGKLVAIDNGTLGIKTGNFTIPSGVTYTGHVGYLAAGNLVLSSAINTNGNVTLNSDWDGVGVGAIVMNSGSSIASNGGNITLGGGTAGDGTGNAVGTSTYINGVYLTGATLNAGGGNIAVSGTGYAATSLANGIYVTGTSTIQTNGAGTITLNGTGGAGTDSNDGVRLGTSASISSVDGAISITGQGAGSGVWNYGLYVHDGATIGATGAGTITLNGTGSAAGTTSNSGVRISASGGATQVTSASGNISITGIGGGDGDGLQVSSGAVVQSNTGGITLSGTSGTGTTPNWGDYGVFIGGPVTSLGGGNIRVTGTSTNVNPGTNSNHGIRLNSGAQVVATGAGTISMTGQGAWDGSGLKATNAALIQSATGAITLTGTGGAGTSDNLGVYLDTSAQVSTVDGAVTLTGHGGAATGASNYGVYLTGGGSTSGSGITSTGTGTITLDGTGGGATDSNYGVRLSTGMHITSTTGDILIKGQGGGTGAGTNNYGIVLTGTSGAVIISNGSANITLDGRGKGGAAGVNTNAINGSHTTGNVTLIADTDSGTDSIILTGPISGTGALLLEPLNAATTIGIAGGAGTFNLSSADLNTIQPGFASLTIGRANGTGPISFGNGGAGYTFNANTVIQNPGLGSGGITVTGPISAGTSGLTLNSGSTIDLGATALASLGGALTLTSGGDIQMRGDLSTTATGLSAAQNAINVQAAGRFIFSGSGGISADSGSIAISGANGVELDNGDWGTIAYTALAGDVTISSTNGDVSAVGGANITGQNVSLSAANGIVQLYGYDGGNVHATVGNATITSGGGGVDLGTGFVPGVGNIFSITAAGIATINSGGGITNSGGNGSMVTANTLGATAVGGIELTTQVANLDTSNTGAGNTLINNTGTLTVNGMTDASGSITLNNAGSMTLSGMGMSANGIFLTASGAASDIVVNSYLESTNGMTVDAGRDLSVGPFYGKLIATAGTQTINVGRDLSVIQDDGSAYVESGSGLQTITVGRDLLVQVNNTSGLEAHIESSGGQTISVGRDLTMNALYSDQTRINTYGGNQLITVGGNMTLNAASDIAHVQSTAGSQTINVTGNLSMSGSSSWDNAYLFGATGQSISVGGNFSMQGGTGTADIVSNGSISVAALSLHLDGGISAGEAGRWLIYAPNPSSVTKGGLVPTLYQYNTAYGGTVASAGSGFVYASQVRVDADFSGTLTSTFGSSPTATPGYLLRGLDSNDTLTPAAIAGTAAFSNWPITTSTAAGSYSLHYASGLSAPSLPYTLTLAQGTSQTYTVDPAAVSIVAIDASLTGTASKVYDGTPTATLTSGNFALTGFVNSDSASVTKTSGTYPSKNVGSNILVSTTLTSGDFSPLGSTNLSNYTLPTSASGNIGVITPASLTVSGVTAQNKVYDATTAATITGTAAISGIFGSDVVTVGGSAIGSFADKNVGTAKPVTVSGLTLSGADAGNYTLSSTSASTKADITPASLTLSGLTAQNKVYDTTTVATITGTAAFTGVLSTDVVTLGGSPIGSFADKNVGVAKPVTVGGLMLSGADAGNYALSSTSASTKADITPASLTLSGLTAQNKVYDATTVATITGTAVFSGVLGTDVVAPGGSASASFADKNVGTAKPVAVSGLSLSGTDAGNYTLSSASIAADITRASLSLSGVVAANKVYDGTTLATLSGGTLAGAFSGDIVSFSGSGNFADKNVGAAKEVTVSVTALTGTDAGNYKLSGPTATTADITVRPLSTWKGGASGNWSEAANWDALPDLSNVLAVSVPAGSVTYDAAAGSTNLTSLTAAGLSIAGGSLNIANNLTVSSSFGQSGGALAFGGGASASITQASGNLNVPALTLANLSLAAPAGAITQSGAIVAAALNTQSQTGTTITNSGNRVGSFTAANNGSGNVALTNTGALTIAGISNSGGNISIDNTGAVSTTGAVSAPSGTVSILAHSPLNIGAAGVSAAGSIALTADATAGSGDTLTLTGPISSTGSGGSIALFAGDDLVQNANVTTNGGAVSALSQTGNISMALGTTTSSGGGSIDYAASSGDVVLTSLNAGSGAIALNAGKGIQPAPGYTGANLIGGNAVIVSGGSANLSTQVRLLDVTVEGRFSVTDILTGTVFTDVPAAAPLPILNQVVSTVVATTQQQPTQTTSQTAAPPPPPPPPTTSGGSGPLLLSNTTQTIGGTADTFGGSSFVDSLPATAAGSSSGTPSSGQGDKPAADKRAADKPADKPADDKLASAKKEDAKADDKKDEKKDDDKKKGEETTAKKEDRPAAKKLPTCGR